MRVLRGVALVLVVAACGYVLTLVFLLASCTESGSGTGDRRPTTFTEP